MARQTTAVGSTRLERSDGIDPRIARRRVAVRRAAGRRRLKVLLAALSVAALCGAAFGIAHSPLLRVRRLEVTAAAPLTRQAVIAASGLGPRSLMVDAAPTAIERRLDAVAWVASAKVKRTWPWTVRMTVSARRAVAELRVGQGSGSVALVDVTGRVLAVEKGPVGGLPALDVATGSLRPGGWLAGTPGASAGGGSPASEPPANLLAALGRPSAPLVCALRFLAGMPANLRSRVESFEPAGRNGAILAVSPGRVRVRLGGDSNLPAKLSALETVLEQVPLAGVHTIDLRVPGRPVLTAGPSDTTVSTTPRG